MKRIYLIVSLVFLTTPLLAQYGAGSRWSELGFLAQSRKLNLVIDYSFADMLGEDYVDFVAGEADWDRYAPEIRSRFIRAFNSEADDGPFPHRIGSYQDADYVIYIHVRKVHDGGSVVKGVMDITDAEGNVFFSREVEGNEGRFGSVCNLMGDAFEELGEDVGRCFFRYARARKVKVSRKPEDDVALEGRMEESSQ